MTIEQNAKLFLESYSKDQYITDFQQLKTSGSSRINWYAKTEYEEYIITYNENLRENTAFFYFSDVFQKLNLNTPKILHISKNQTFYIQEFLGKNTLLQLIEKEGFSFRVQQLVKKVLEKLYALQIATHNQIDYKKTFEYEQYNHLPIIHDLYYFKNFMVDILEIPYHKSSLLKEFYAIAKKVEAISPTTLMMRDFQARNIIINSQDKVSFIDYQSAMKGPMMYDVISFLYQAKANFPNHFKEEMLNYYIFFHQSEDIQIALKQSIQWIQLMRFLQVLGAYGFRGLIQKKPHFVQSIKQGIENIVHFIQNWEYSQNFPELKDIIFNLKSEYTKHKILSMTK